MDYSSALTNESEHVGSSPWASSPQHNRTSFGPPTNDIPSSPLPPRSPYADDDIQEHGFGSPRIGGDDSLTSPVPGGFGDQGGHAQTDSHQPTSPQRQHQQQRQPQSPPQDQQQGNTPQRYHGARPRHNQNQPQYKLQAKVTGLERTGRKDPILRFDVYVRRLFPYCGDLQLIFCVFEHRQTCQNSAPPNSAT